MTGAAERLRTPEATEEDVQVYLAERSQQVLEAGGEATPAETYWRQGDLARYRMCEAVWVSDAPPVCALPDLPTLLNGVAGPRGMTHTTFLHDLGRLWARYAEWMALEGRDPYRAGEAPDRRRARQARESMARTRARRSGADPARAALLEAAKAAHEAYLAACRRRKRVSIALDERVRLAWAAYEAARDAAKG